MHVILVGGYKLTDYTDDTYKVVLGDVQVGSGTTLGIVSVDKQ